MEANNKPMRKVLTDLVDYLNNEVKRTSKCNGCQYYDNGRSFRCEPCFWHIDCGIDGCDIKASDNAKYLLKRFKLQGALATPPRNCDRFQTVEQAKKVYCAEVRRIFVWDGCETERLVDWLLATTTEKEGGNNAD